MSTVRPAGARDAGAPDRILTVPNALSGLRLRALPGFLWRRLGANADGWAVDGPVSNSEAFAKAFAGKTGDPMVRARGLVPEIW
mgnify:CR=1 FL=1